MLLREFSFPSNPCCLCFYLEELVESTIFHILIDAANILQYGLVLFILFSIAIKTIPRFVIGLGTDVMGNIRRNVALLQCTAH